MRSVGSTEAPPHSNRGVTITSESVALADWFEFTIPTKEILPSEMAARLGREFGGMTPGNRGRYGYSSLGTIYGTGWLAWDDGRPEMGVHVCFPSAALGTYAGLGGDVKTLYALCICSGGKVTRFDIAVDSHEIAMSTVLEAWQSGQGVTQAVWHERVLSYERKKGEEELVGDTFYIGAPSSDCRVRFYDKRLERLHKGETVDHPIWTRCELQLRHEPAHRAAEAIFSEDVDPGSIIRGKVDFRERGEGNVTRASALKWWVAWMAVTIVKLPAQGTEQQLEKMRSWIVRQVSLTLATVIAHDQGDMSWLYSAVKEAWRHAPGWRRQIAES